MATKKKMLQAAAGVGGEPEGAWDLSYAYYDEPFLGSVLNSFRIGVLYVNAQEAAPTGVSFKLDGTKMYVIGISGDDVNEYNLSTAWKVSTAVFSQSFSISAQETAPQDVTFKSDGTKMYVLGYTGKDVNEYSLSTAWDVSSASYTQNFSVSSQGDYPYGIFFKPDGTKMYVIDIISGKLSEYTLSTAWDVSSASLEQQFTYRNLSTQLYQGTAVAFSQDGIFMYILCRSDYQTGVKGVYRFTLSTAWDISTAVLGEVGPTVNNTNPLGMFLNPDLSRYYVIGDTTDRVNEYSMGGFSTSAQEALPNGVEFKPDGSKMYIVGTTGDDVNEYSANSGFSILSENLTAQDVQFKPDGTKMYIIGVSSDKVSEYDLSTAWDILTASYVQDFSVAAQETDATGLFFKPDGTKMYVVGQVGDDVNEYSLSTAWDVTSASYSQNFSISSQETTAQGIFFKPDGTKMYVIGYGSGNVNEYNLSTAWDVSTASFSQSFSIIPLYQIPTAVFFKPDGTKMYVVLREPDDVLEYDLSTAWDVSSASYSQSFSVSGQDTSPTGLFFKPDGSKMYVVGFANDKVYEYTLSTAWDVSTASVIIPEENLFNLSQFSYTQSFSVAAQEINPYAVRFKPDGTKMYIVGASTTSILEYSLSTAWDVSSASYVQNILYDAGDPNTRGLFFKPDGTKMYLTGVSADAVSEYNITTAWDISTAVFSQRFSVLTEENNPNDVFFKPDGTKMYVAGTGGDDVNEYDLSTAWDVSSASYNQNFSFAAQTANPIGLFIKEDGTQMFIVTPTGDLVFTYSLGVQE